jgi:hypothetical protein
MEPRNRINTGRAGGLVISALMVDAGQMLIGALSLIPIIGMLMSLGGNLLLSLASALGFYIALKTFGVTFIDGAIRKVMTYLTGLFLEIIGSILPLIQFFPVWTFTVILTIYIVRKEDREYNRKNAERISAAQSVAY